MNNELFCILGHNGAGKSTLINMLIGIIPPTTNTAYVLGHDIRTNIEDARHDISIIPQFDILYEDLTVYQNMQIICDIKNVLIEENIHKNLKIVDLLENINDTVKTLSGGMRRRVSLAISLIGNPKV